MIYFISSQTKQEGFAMAFMSDTVVEQGISLFETLVFMNQRNR